MIFEHLQEWPGSGVYLMMSWTATRTLREAGLSDEEIETIVTRCLPDEEVQAAVAFPTSLRRLRDPEFDRIYRHGWEVADCNLRVRRPDLFPVVATGRLP